MDHTGGSSQPVQHPPAGRAAALRQAWREGISALGPDAELPGLRSLLDSRLSALEQEGTLDEASLLAVAEEGSHLALEAGSAELARSLSRRLRRCIYEFLLALDAAPVETAAATPVAPLEPSRPARWGQVLIGVEEVEAVEAAQRREGEPASPADLALDHVVGADDRITAEVARAVARSEDGEEDQAWSPADAGALVELADTQADDVSALRALLEDAMQSGLDVDLPTLPLDLPTLPLGQVPEGTSYATASAAAQAFAASVAEARAAAEAEEARLGEEARLREETEAQAVAEAEEARRREEAEEHAEALLAQLEEAEAAAAGAVLLRLRLEEVLPPPGTLDPEAMRVPPSFRREPVPAPVEGELPPLEPALAPLVRSPFAPLPPRPSPPVEETLPEPVPSLFPIAPREGFHLTDPSMIDVAIRPAPSPAPGAAAALAPVPPQPVPPPPAALAATPPAAAFTQAPVPTPPPASRWSLPATPAPTSTSHAPSPSDPSEASGWNIRQSPRQQMLTERMAQKRREEAVRAAQEAAAIAAALAEPERKRRRGKPAAPERIADVAIARDLIEQQLRRKRGAEAAALLQRLAAELPGREAADLALDSGDRCLALGQNRSATNCYLAGWRADPSYELPLWRLADVCLSDREIALATGYLERIAELMRARGDDAGALAVYRKIVTVAPDREDIRRLVRLAQATGRLEI